MLQRLNNTSMKYKLPQKPHLLKIIPPSEKSIIIKGDKIDWNNPWHFHPEIELLYCIKGKGTNFIGNYIAAIEEGELLLLGKNLPHTRQRDRSYYESNPDEQPETIVIQFQDNFLGKDFFNIEEFAHIKPLLAKSTRGLKFHGVTKENVVQILKQINNMDPALSITEFLRVLHLLARSSQYKYLNSESFYIPSAHEESVRINIIYRYTVDHFQDQVHLADVASRINLSVPAFSRFFKSRTRKTYFQYPMEVRIAYACKVLMGGNTNISEVCFACGFNNLSNFHKQFKNIMGVTPGRYRKNAQKRTPQPDTK